MSHMTVPNFKVTSILFLGRATPRNIWQMAAVRTTDFTQFLAVVVESLSSVQLVQPPGL